MALTKKTLPYARNLLLFKAGKESGSPQLALVTRQVWVWKVKPQVLAEIIQNYPIWNDKLYLCTGKSDS